MKIFEIRWVALIVVTSLILGWWYWYQYQPQEREEECYRFSLQMTRGAMKSGEGSWSTDERYHEVVKLFQRSCVDAGGVGAFEKILNASNPLKKPRR